MADVLGAFNGNGLNTVRAGMIAVRNSNRNSLDDVISALRNLQLSASRAYDQSVIANGPNSNATRAAKDTRDAYGKFITAFNIYFRYLSSRSSLFETFGNWADRNTSFKQQRIGLTYPYGATTESYMNFTDLLTFMPLNAPSSGGATITGGGGIMVDPRTLTGGGITIFNNPIGTGSFVAGGGTIDPFVDPNFTGSRLPTDDGPDDRDLIGPDRPNDPIVVINTPVPCQNPRYWIKVSRDELRTQRVLVGPDGFDKFDIGYPCVLNIEIYRCCEPVTVPGLSLTAQQITTYNSTYNPGKAQQVAAFSVTGKNAWVHEPCNVSERFPGEGFLKGKGKLFYTWYFDLEDVIKATYSALNYTPSAQRTAGISTTLLSEIHSVMATTRSPFVAGKNITQSNLCISAPLGIRGTYTSAGYNSSNAIDSLAKYYGLKPGFPAPGRLLPTFDYLGYKPIEDSTTSNTYKSAGIIEALLIQLEISSMMNLWSLAPSAYQNNWSTRYKDTTVLLCKGLTETERDCIGTPPPAIADDCTKPWKGNGDMLGWWNFKETISNDYQDIQDNVNKDTYKNGLYESLTLAPGRVDGAVQIVPGKTFVFKGSNIVSKQIVRTEKRTIDRTIAGSDCWAGYFDINKYRIKRLRKHYIELFCVSGAKIDYLSSYDSNGRPIMAPIPNETERRALNNTTFSKGDTGKYVSTMVMQQFGARNPKIETIGPNLGQWYIWTENEYDVINYETGTSEFTDRLPKFGSIELNKNGNCIPKEECKYLGWQLDTSNPCGCVDIEVYNCYNVYMGFTYYDDMGNPITIQDVREPKDFGNTYAKYMLPAGYKVTGEQPSLSPECNESSIKIYHPLLFGQDVIRGSKKNIMMGLFNTSQSLLCYYTSSTQDSVSKDYYYEITDCDNCNKKSYYAVAYGNRFGSGSLSIGYDYSDSPSRAIYGQNKLLCLEPPENTFKFYNSGTENTPNDIYVINFNRDGLSHRIDPGNFEINLAELSGSSVPNHYHTGSNVMVSGSNPKILRLIDNSGDSDDSQFCVEAPFTSYDLVSGSIEDGVHESGVGTTITTYGKVYPNLNLLVFDGSKLNSYLSFNSVTGSNIAGDNAFKLHTSISGAAVVGYPMKARNVREKTTNHYFIRIPSRHANYSTNPTFVTEDTTRIGSLKYDCFVQNPVTYVTSVGLYNPKRELLAIAKLSRPIQKSLENDVLIKIRLNW